MKTCSTSKPTLGMGAPEKKRRVPAPSRGLQVKARIAIEADALTFQLLDTRVNPFPQLCAARTSRRTVAALKIVHLEGDAIGRPIDFLEPLSFHLGDAAVSILTCRDSPRRSATVGTSFDEPL